MPRQQIEKEYQKDGELKKEEVQILVEWTQKQPHLPQISESQAIWFLQSCYFRMEPTKTALDNFFTVRTLCPEIFTASLDDRLLKLSMDIVLFATLPQRTPEGYTVFWCSFIDSSPDLYHFNAVTKFFDIVMMLDLYINGTSKGLYIVFDMEGGTLSHLTKVNIMTVKKYLYYLQEALPVRLKGVHIINVVPFVDRVVSMVKPFLKNELVEMLNFHKNSIETFYKFVPKNIVPKDYGGLGPSKQELHEETNRKIGGNFDFYNQLQQLKVDEKCRPGKPKDSGDIFGVDGTFKKLEVD